MHQEDFFLTQSYKFFLQHNRQESQEVIKKFVKLYHDPSWYNNGNVGYLYFFLDNIFEQEEDTKKVISYFHRFYGTIFVCADFAINCFFCFIGQFGDF